MSEEDTRTIKGVSAILEYIACSNNDVKYTGEAMGMLSNMLMDVAERNEKAEN